MRTAMTFTRVTTIAVLLFAGAAPAGAQAIKLEFHDGQVNLTTQNASMRAILTEWARLGGTQVVNADRLAGTPLTLQLTNVPETQALDIILRGNAGYIAGLRRGTTEIGTRSTLDRIMVVPTIGTAAPVASRPATAPPAFVAPQPRITQADPDDNPVSDVPPADDLPPNRGSARPGVPINIQRTPQGLPQPFQPFQSQDDDSTPQPTSPPAPANPFGIQTGSPRPGTITPVPQQPTRPPTQRADPEP